MLKEIAGVPQMHIGGTVDRVSTLTSNTAHTYASGGYQKWVVLERHWKGQVIISPSPEGKPCKRGGGWISNHELTKYALPP